MKIKVLLTLLTAMFLLVACQCGSAVQKKQGPPWASFSDGEVLTYTEKYTCPEATAFVRNMGGDDWSVVNEESETDQTGYFIEILSSAEGNLAARIYRKVDEGKKVTALVIDGTTNSYILDYYTFKKVLPVLISLKEGTMSDEVADVLLTEAYNASTGEYFCYIIRNNVELF